jgi:hypothetical protein
MGVDWIYPGEDTIFLVEDTIYLVEDTIYLVEDTIYLVEETIYLVEDNIERPLKAMTFLFYVYARRRISLPAVQLNFIKYPIRYRLSVHPSSCALPCVTGALVDTQTTSSC